jgi:hypothetical protein
MFWWQKSNTTLAWRRGGNWGKSAKRIFTFVFWTIWLNLFLFCLHFISTSFEFCLQLAKKIGMAGTTATWHHRDLSQIFCFCFVYILLVRQRDLRLIVLSFEFYLLLVTKIQTSTFCFVLVVVLKRVPQSEFLKASSSKRDWQPGHIGRHITTLYKRGHSP